MKKFINAENITAVVVVIVGMTIASIFVIGPVSRLYTRLTSKS